MPRGPERDALLRYGGVRPQVVVGVEQPADIEQVAWVGQPPGGGIRL